jgi:hypothetical protein
VVEVVTQTPGINSVAISKALGRSRNHCLKALQVGSRHGLVGCVYTAPKHMGWFPTALLAKAKADWQTKMEQRRTETTAKRIQAMLEAQDEDDVPIRRSAPVDAPLPFRCTAVNSVFALGAVS